MFTCRLRKGKPKLNGGMIMKGNEEHDIQKELKRYELFFKKRYKVLYTVNDFIIGAMFLVGSFFFFYGQLFIENTLSVNTGTSSQQNDRFFTK